MIELGLSRISQLVKYTPLTWKAVHIAGTNGKGSVASYLSGLLQRGDIRTGRFTSPHLIDRWDCIVIDGKSVSKDLFNHVEGELHARNEEGKIGASEFELLTATAFDIFNQARIDVGVVEVGLGGRLDATNVLTSDDVMLSIITKIGLDHQALLGNSLSEIATEKGGIIKKGVPCLADGTNAPEVLAALEACAVKAAGANVQTPIRLSPRSLSSKNESALEGVLSKLDLEPHQSVNIRLAVDALNIVQERYPVKRPLASLFQDIPKIKWPGRLQNINLDGWIERREEILLDGAHNIQSAEVLGRHVQRKMRQPGVHVTWVVAMSKGKPVHELLRCWVQPGDFVIATHFGTVDGMPWVESAPAEDISAAALGLDCRSAAAENVEEALMRATEVARSGPLVVAGSLYLVSDVLRGFRDWSDEDPTQRRRYEGVGHVDLSTFT
jgi:folylpolyglutamate synthase/dihydrofolate synthase